MRATIRLISLKVSCLILVYLNFTLMVVILVKGVNVCERLAHKSRLYFTTLMKWWTYLWEVGGFIFLLLLLYIYIGFMPSCITQKPKYSILVCLKKYFSVLYLSTFSFSLFRVNYIFCTWFFQCTFVNTKISSIYAWIDFIGWS